MRLTRTRRYALLRNAAKRLVPKRFPEPEPFEEDPELEHPEQVLLAWPSGVRKPNVGLVCDPGSYAYWTKYRRFLQANDIPFEIYDVHRSSWLRDAQCFDIVVWRPMSSPHELEECRRKFHILETQLGVLCYPSFAEAQMYEDKIAQYELLKYHGLPVIDTLVSNSQREALEYLGTCDYPLVWKLAAGSGSVGVELVRTRRTAERWVRRAFDFAGRRTYWPYVSQKNYVYLQKFIPDAGTDVRVIVIGSLAFGFYRDVPKGDFRASGMHTVRWGALPEGAVHLARRVAQCFDMPYIAVDMIAESAGTDFRIIEVSCFTGEYWGPERLCQDGVSGAYVFDGPGEEYRFVPMRVWPQELVLKRLLETRWLTRER